MGSASLRDMDLLYALEHAACCRMAAGERIGRGPFVFLWEPISTEVKCEAVLARGVELLMRMSNLMRGDVATLAYGIRECPR